MPDDIYTKRPIITDSKEHVIPNFLGGRLQPLGLIDKDLNSEFGRGIETALDRALLSFRTWIDARSHRAPSTPAPSLRGIEGADGESYRVEAGGKVKVRPEISVKETDGNTRIVGRVADKRELRQALKRIAQKKGWNLDDLLAKILASAEHSREAAPPMTFHVALWDLDPYRAIVKMACNLFAYHHRAVFLQSEFDSVRAFVLEGAGGAPSFVQATDADVRANGLGQLDHLVTVEIDPHGRAHGLVVLFGVLAFVVRLGDLISSTISRHSYRVDQLGRLDRFDHADDCRLPIEPFEIAAARSYEEFAALTKNQLHRLLPEALRLQEETWLRQLVESHWNRLDEGVGDAEVPTEQALREFAAAVAEEVTDALLPQIEAASRQQHAHAAALHSATSATANLASDDTGS